MATAASPDGKYVVLDLQGTLWLLPIEGGKAQSITDKTLDARQPAWSPDGNYICFQAYINNNWHIYTVKKDGSELKALTKGLYDHREPHWSSDGKSIVFSSDMSGNYDIWSVLLESNQLTQITDDLTNEYGPAYAHHSDDIVYVSTDMDEYYLKIFSTQKGTHSQIYSSESKIFAPTWTLMDSNIVFNELNGLNSSLNLISLKDMAKKVLSDDTEDIFPFRVSSVSGQDIIYSASGKIWRKNLLTNEKKSIAFKAPITLHRSDYEKKKRTLNPSGPQELKGIHCPKISPDGNKVSFIAFADVWIKDITSTQSRRVTDDSFIQLMPVWTRDGQQLIYASDQGGETALWKYDLSKDLSTKIDGIAAMPSGLEVSPDNKKIAITMAFGPRSGHIQLMDIQTGEIEKVGRPLPYSISSPSWTIDGSKIVVTILSPYSSLYREGINRIVIVDVKTGTVVSQQQPEHQSFGARSNDGPVLSPNGSKMAYISQGLLWVANINKEAQPAGEPVKMTEELADVPSWSGDGSSLLYMSYDKLKMIDINTKKTNPIDIDLTYSATIDTSITSVHAGWIITMVNGRILENQDILIKAGKIIGIEDHQEDRKASKLIDASKDYIMPGLVDIHAHQGSDLGEVLGRKWLSWGVTSTRDPATYPYDALNRKEAQLAGSLLHPRIFFTGSPIDGNRVYYNGTYAEQSLEQVKRELQRAKALDYDLIKTYVRLSDSIQQYVVDYAHSLGIPVTSHEVYPAAAYNTDGVEHIMGTSRRGYTPKMSETFRSYSDVSDIIVSAGMSFTPTISIYGGYEYLLSKNPEFIQDERLQNHETPWIISFMKDILKKSAEHQKDWQEKFRRQSGLIMDIYEKGGLIVAGTDSPIIPYGFGLFIELMCYQEAGMPPIDVLRSATINSSKVLQVDDQLGTIEIGKLADMLILKKNPLENISNLRSLKSVILNGQKHDVKSMLIAPIK